MFDSPMEHCPVCGNYVALDQPQAECAIRQNCPEGTVCPLFKAFTEISFNLATVKDRAAGNS